MSDPCFAVWGTSTTLPACPALRERGRPPTCAVKPAGPVPVSLRRTEEEPSRPRVQAGTLRGGFSAWPAATPPAQHTAEAGLGQSGGESAHAVSVFPDCRRVHVAPRTRSPGTGGATRTSCRPCSQSQSQAASHLEGTKALVFAIL